MSKILKYFLTITINLSGLFILFSSIVKATNTPKIVFYYGQGCSHCAKVEEYFTQKGYFQKYKIEKKEVYFDTSNAAEMNSLFEKHNIPISQRGVPTLLFNDKVIVGDREIIGQFSSLVGEKEAPPSTDKTPTSSNLTIPLVVGAALVDSINPCAFAVLIILLSSMTIIKRDKTALKGGLLFAFGIFLSYFLMGLGIYKALASFQLSLTLLKAVGVLALILGVWNLVDFAAYNKHIHPIEVPMSWRPKMKSIIRKATSPLGAFIIGMLISLFLVPCTSGPYLVIISMLSQKVTFVPAVFYLLLHNLIFVTPMVIITLLVYRGLDPEKAENLRQKNIHRLHLIAGLILLAMGGYITFIY